MKPEDLSRLLEDQTQPSTSADLLRSFAETSETTSAGTVRPSGIQVSSLTPGAGYVVVSQAGVPPSFKDPTVNWPAEIKRKYISILRPALAFELKNRGR